MRQHIIDTLIFGTSSERVQSKLLEKDEKLTLDHALAIARTEEATWKKLEDLHTSSMSVNIPQAKHRGRPVNSKSQKTPSKPQHKHINQKTCGNCSTSYEADPDVCPAKGERETNGLNNNGLIHAKNKLRKRTKVAAKGDKCLACGRLNHWKRMCRAQKAHSNTPLRKVHELQTERQSSYF